MAISTQIQNLNLIPGKSAPVVVHLSQGNVGNTVQFYLYDGDNPYYPTNVSIAVHGVRADNTVFGPYAVSVTSGSNLVSFDIVTAMTSVTGAAIGELVITDGNHNQIGSANFGMLVEATPYSSSVTYEDDLSIYQRILAYVQSIPASISGQVAAEKSARESAIATLQNSIRSEVAQETLARQNADNSIISSLQSAIDSEAATRLEKDNALQTQINQHVAPATENPSEVVNARVGYNGTSYANLGEAVRGQVSDLHTEFNDLTDELYYNLFPNAPSQTTNGVTITYNAELGVYVLSGTCTANTYLNVKSTSTPAYPAGSYMLYSKVEGTIPTGTLIYCRNASSIAKGNITIFQTEHYVPFTTTDPLAILTIILIKDVSYNCSLRVMLTKGTEERLFVPYKRTLYPWVYPEYYFNEAKQLNEIERPWRNYNTVFETTSRSNFLKWGHSAGVLTHIDNTVRASINIGASLGVKTPEFLMGNLSSTDILVTATVSVTTGQSRVWLCGTVKSTGAADGYWALRNGITGTQNISIIVDLASHAVYRDFDSSKPFRIMVSNTGNQVADFTVTDLKIVTKALDTPYINSYEAINGGELLKNIESHAVSLVNDFAHTSKYYRSPNGTKYIINVNDDGTIGTIPVAPSKSFFVGNSLIGGWMTYGMAATEVNRAYYYYITSKIHELNNNATYSWAPGNSVEHSESEEAFNTAWDYLRQFVTSDLDLICIQLGDNVNTDAKRNQFQKSGGSFDTIVDYVRTNCPNTRLVWVGTWYESIHNWLKDACQRKHVEFIDIFDLSTPGNKCPLGTVAHRTEDREQTLTGTYTANGNSLLLTVTIYNRTYTATIPSYTSVTDNGNGTFTMVAPYTVVDSSGIASHPGDSGMLAIANRVCYNLGLTDSETEITQN